MKPSPLTSLVSALKAALQEKEEQKPEPLLRQERRRGKDGVWRTVLVGRQKTIREHLEKYWKSVDKRSPDECWPWRGHFHSGKWAYGTIYFYGKHIAAHRLAYIIANLVDPHPLLVCHKCDNPICQNPSHYFLGTHAENMADMRKKGRSLKARGESHNKAVLTEAQVREIRTRIKERGSHKGLLAPFAREYGVKSSAMWSIFKGDTWKRVTV
jgi:hypothetical protein